MPAPSSWTPEREKTAVKLWNDGLSAGQIAKELGGGVSRNAVIGKIHRLGMCQRNRPSPPAKLPKPSKTGRPRKVQAKQPAGPKPTKFKVRPDGAILRHPPGQALPRLRCVETGPGKPWTERVFGECAYPVSGDGADTWSCCAKVKAESSYCAAHHGIMFRPAKVKPKTERLRVEHVERWAA